MKVKKTRLRSRNSESGNILLTVALAVAGFVFIITNIMAWLPVMDRERVKSQNLVDYSIALGSVLDYTKFIIKERWCIQNGSLLKREVTSDTGSNGCSTDLETWAADDFNMERYILGMPALQSGEEDPNNPGQLVGEGLNIRLGRDLEDRTLLLGYDNSPDLILSVSALESPAHPLNIILSTLRDKESINRIRIRIRRVQSTHLPVDGLNTYLKVSADIIYEEGSESLFKLLKDPHAETILGFHPRENNTFALIVGGNLRLDLAATDAAPSGAEHAADFVIPKIKDFDENRDLAEGSQGLVFAGRVFVNKDLVLPTSGTDYNATSFSDKVVLGQGRMKQSAGGSNPDIIAFSPRSAGGIRDRFLSQLTNQFGGAAQGIVSQGRPDLGLEYLFDLRTGAAVDTNLAQSCSEETQSLVDLKLTKNSQVVVQRASSASDDSEGGSGGTFPLRIGLTQSKHGNETVHNRIMQQTSVTAGLTNVSGNMESGVSKANQRFDSVSFPNGADEASVMKVKLEIKPGHFAEARVGRNGSEVLFKLKRFSLSAATSGLQATVDSLQANYDAVMAAEGATTSNFQSAVQDLKAANDTFDTEQANLEADPGVSKLPPNPDLSERDDHVNDRNSAYSGIPGSIPNVSDVSNAQNYINKVNAFRSQETDLFNFYDNDFDRPPTDYGIADMTARNAARADRDTKQGNLTSKRNKYSGDRQKVVDYNAAIQALNDANAELADFDNTQPQILVRVVNEVEDGKTLKNVVRVEVETTQGWAFLDGDAPKLTFTLFDVGYDGSGKSVRTANSKMQDTEIVYNFNLQTGANRKLVGDSSITGTYKSKSIAQGGVATSVAVAEYLPNPSEDATHLANTESCTDSSLSYSTASFDQNFSEYAKSSWHFAPVDPDNASTYLGTTLVFDGDNASTLGSAVGGSDWNWPVYSIVDRCLVTRSANFVVGFYTCLNLEIERRSTPLTLIGSFIVKNAQIHPSAIKRGTTFYSIYHPNAVALMRRHGVLGPGESNECDRLVDQNERRFSPVWHPDPALNTLALYYSCFPNSLRAAADPWKWTQVDPDCARLPGEPFVKCKRRPREFELGVISYSDSVN